MERILVKDLGLHIGSEVRIAGWLHNVRRLGKFAFLLLRDRTGIAQVIVDTKDNLDLLLQFQDESVLEVMGAVVAQANAPNGFEIHGPAITVLSPVKEVAPFPINKSVLNVNLDTFLDNASFGLRHPKKQAVFKLSSALMTAFRASLNKEGFTEVTTPKIVGSATESGASVFRLDYFGRNAYLAQSPQFYKQIMVGVFERVFEIGPVFRAEPHSTSRHLNEYVSLDAEMGFIEDHTTVMSLLTGLVRDMVTETQSQCAREIEMLSARPPLMPEVFPAICFADAQQLLQERHNEDMGGELDLSPQHERLLCEWSAETYQSDFVFVTGYPMAKRPFYTHPQPSNHTYANGFDLLFRGLELVTGGQRLHLYDDYVSALEERNLPIEPFEGYLQAFKYGMPPHGGFAIGLERFTMQLLGLQNLRETTLFPRDMNRVAP